MNSTTAFHNVRSWRGPLLAIALLALAGGCVTDADSNRGPDAGAACADGCALDGECLEGTSESACGVAGDLCVICDEGEVCDEGACVAAGCDASNCDGCCDGATCLSGTSAGACGSGGEACVDCGPRGVCASEEENTCEIDPASRWNIVAKDATLPEHHEGGGTWDPSGGLPDGYSRALLDDERLGQTSVDKDTLTPRWEEPVAPGVRASEVAGLVIEVLDRDVDADDLIGRCTLPELGFDRFGGGEFRVACPQGSGWQMSLVIEPN